MTIGNASAWAGIFEIQNETFFDGDWTVANAYGSPEKNTKSSGNIRAWIDIIGFENMSIIDGAHYVNGSAKDFAIVKRDAWYTSVSGTVVSFQSTYDISDSIVGNATNNLTNTTTATQTTNLHWKYKVTTLYGFYWVHVYEGPLTVSHTVDAPKKFNNDLDIDHITIVAYNNSVSPYTLIYIPDRWNVIKTKVEYKNNATHFYNYTGLVTTNDRGTEHVDFLNNSFHAQDETDTVMVRAYYSIINEAPLNWSLLNISMYTPYIEHKNHSMNITVINSKPSDYINSKAIVVFLTMLSIFVAGVYIALNRR